MLYFIMDVFHSEILNRVKKLAGGCYISLTAKHTKNVTFSEIFYLSES